jgi:hypothetical protein
MKVMSAKRAVVATGLKESLITGVHLNDVTIHAEDAGKVSFIKDWDLKGVRIIARNGSVLKMEKKETK